MASVHAPFETVMFPTTPVPTGTDHPLQSIPIAAPLVEVPVHTLPGIGATGLPLASTLMGASIDPSVRSAQLLAICVPFTSAYGPLACVKRVATGDETVDIHAR